MILETKQQDIAFVGTKFIFSRMQVLIWCSNGTSLLHSVEKNACDTLADLITNYCPDKPLVLNFKGIVNIDDHAFDNIFKALEENTRQLIIVNGYHLFEKINRLKKESKASLNSNADENWVSIGKPNNIVIQDIEFERKLLIETFIKETVKESFVPFSSKKRLHSTPILANGEYNSNLILSDIRKFIWTCFFLSDEIERIIDKHKLNNIKLLTASLRGAPFAAMIGLIKNYQFETIDHFGPKHKVFDIEFLNRIEKDTNYIYIGDYCFGGTEIKLAKTYTEMKSAKLCHALVIGNLIDSLHFQDEFELTSLQSLNGLNSNAQFTLQ